MDNIFNEALPGSLDFLWGVGLILSLGLAPYLGAADDVQCRLEAGGDHSLFYSKRSRRRPHMRRDDGGY